MTFELARAEVTSRCDEALQLFAVVCSTRSKPNIQRMEGLAFVDMYAFYEFAVHAAVKNALAAVRDAKMPISRLSDGFLGLVLEPELKSCSEKGREKRWAARREMFRRLQTGTTDDLCVDLFPDDGSHYRRDQLDTIWAVLGIGGRIVPDGRIFPLIGELVENRNAVAHGRERPETIGRMYSNEDVRRKFRQSQRLCRHILTAVERRAAEIVTSTP